MTMKAASRANARAPNPSVWADAQPFSCALTIV